MSKRYLLAPTPVPAAHKKWLDKEKKRTGNPFTVIVRDLIQEKINEEAAQKVQSKTTSI